MGDQFWQTLFLDSPQPALRLNRDGEVRETNSSARVLLGMADAALRGRPIASLIGLGEFREIYTAMKSGRTWQIPCTFIKPANGRDAVVSVKFSLLPANGGGDDDVICYLSDIGEDVYTERLLDFFAFAERKLDPMMESEKVYLQSVEFAADKLADWCVLFLDQGGKLVPVAESEPEAALQHPATGVRLEEAVRTGKAHFSPDLIVVPLRRDFEIIGAICMGIIRRPFLFTRLDLVVAEELAGKIEMVSERASLYKKLGEMTAVALAANQAKSYFLANVSHEIRTPLGAILGFVELFFAANQNPGEQAMWKSKIRKNASHLLRIVDDILDLSKVEAGRLEVISENVDLVAFLSDVMDILEPRSTEKGIALSIAFDNPVPRMIRSDLTRLSQILYNIAGNAIKFTSKGEIAIRVAYKAPHLSFAISDTGPGLTPDQAALLFEPFSQAENSYNRRFDGTGLGLALSRRLANKLGGDVQLSHTRPGAGSTFTVTIDAKAGADVELVPVFTRQSSAEDMPAGELMRLDGKRILVVDDSADNQFLLGSLLNSAGACVEFASDGQEALCKAHGAPYEVILMDLQMPIKDGYTATRELRASGYVGPIVALTACAMKEERMRSFEAGCNFHLTKPVVRDQLLSTLGRCLQAN